MNSKQLTAHIAKPNVLQGIVDRSLDNLRESPVLKAMAKRSGLRSKDMRQLLGMAAVAAIEETVAELKRELPWA